MLKTKPENLITAGEFARLSQSTKRTVHWYTNLGLLKPKSINSKGYKFYSTEQIIDFQVIMLLRKLDFSLPEIKKFLRKNASTKQLFLQKKKLLLKQIADLQKKLKDISTFYENLETEGVLVKPSIKTVPSFSAYTFEKVGSYSSIYGYLKELKSHFSSIPKKSVYFVYFLDRGYSPKKDRFKIGVVAAKKMQLKETAKDIVQLENISSFKSLQYTHVGSPALISMLIMQMHEYMTKKKIKQDLTLPINELEFYSNFNLNGNPDENTMVSEINIPII